jgi:hypothetical protein
MDVHDLKVDAASAQRERLDSALEKIFNIWAMTSPPEGGGEEANNMQV